MKLISLSRALVATSVFSGVGAAQIGPPLNEHTIYNRQKTQFATRATTSAADTIYFSQLLNLRNNGSLGTGWRLIAQDQEQQTAELVTLSWHATASDGTPNVSALAAKQFSLFGTNSGTAAFVYTLSTVDQTPLPQQVALGIELPVAQSWPADAALLHYQRGDNTRVAPRDRFQMTFRRDGASAVPEWVVGSTFYWGGLYLGPVLSAYVLSSAYGAGLEALYGPEAFYPDPLRGDKLGFIASGHRFLSLRTQQPSLGIVFAGSKYVPPVPTPWGPVLIDATGVTFGVALTDEQGLFRVPPLPVPNLPLELVFQVGLANLQLLEIGVTNAIKVRI